MKTSPALELARRWSAGGASVAVYQFPRSLNLPHDIAEEAHSNADPAVVYPALEAVIHGERPPLVLSENRLWPRDDNGIVAHGAVAEGLSGGR